MDKITLERIKLLHPLVRGEVDEIYKEICEALKGRAMCRFAYTLRTLAEQAELYAIGRSKSPKLKRVTNAAPGFSYHNYGLAIDIVLIWDKDGNGSYETASWDTKMDFDGDGKADWIEVVEIFRKYGWAWGGNWAGLPDAPHFERTFGYSAVELKRLFDAKKVITNTNYVLLSR